MNKNTTSSIISAISLLVRPIIRLALRNGLTFRQFSEMCKAQYVDVASSDYGVDGRETNISRIALLSGINRKDIKRLKDSLKNNQDILNGHTPDRISRILSGWFTDPIYLSEADTPAILPLEGQVSFNSLVKQYGGDIAAVTLVREFKRSAVIEEIEPGQFKVLKRYFIPNLDPSTPEIPESTNPQAILHASNILNDHVNTIFHNLYLNDKSQNNLKRFERRTTNTNVDESIIDDFKLMIEEKAQQFLEDVDSWLSDRESCDTSKAKIRLGIGSYWIEEHNRTSNN